MLGVATVPHLLIVDDESAFRRLLLAALGQKGFILREASSGEGALGALEQAPADLVILDVRMPGMGGIEACRRIRRKLPSIGIVMTSVMGREADHVIALDAGADDYVTKPFRGRELLARIRSVLRRVPCLQADPSPTLSAGDLVLDPETRILKKAGAEVRLSRKEFGILEFLMRHQDVPVPHARLLKAVWGPEYGGETEYLRTYVKSLRRKIEQDPALPRYIQTEPWVGYRFRDPSPVALTT